MEITLDPYGPGHPCAAETDPTRQRRAWISRRGVVHIGTNSSEALHRVDPIDNYDGLAEFAREADAALRAAVADQ